MNAVFDLTKPIAIGADHAGFEYKSMIVDLLNNKGYNIKDFGTNSAASVDYPDFAHPVANAITNGDAECGILLCGSANGVAIAANKHQEIRAAVCWENEIAVLSRKHNDANIICIPTRFVAIQVAEEMIDVFFATAFEGGRHERRVEKIACS